MTHFKGIPILRTCDAEGRGARGFQYPRSGWVEDPHWDPSPTAGRGLHGLAYGQGVATQLSSAPDAVWLVIDAAEADVVELTNTVGGTKSVTHVKFRGGEVRYYGDRDGAIQLLASVAGDRRPLPFWTVVRGEDGIAQTGLQGFSVAGENGVAISGDEGHSAAGPGGSAITGIRGRAVAGVDGEATGGMGATLVLPYVDEGGRIKQIVVKVDGVNVRAGVAYRAGVLDGELEEVVG